MFNNDWAPSIQGPYKGSQRDVVYLGLPIAPAFMNPNEAEGGGGEGGNTFNQWVHMMKPVNSRQYQDTKAPYFSCCVSNTAATDEG
jgi:hypothetical protein